MTIQILINFVMAREYRSIQIPNNYISINFSHDGERVAFCIQKDNKFYAEIDGKKGKIYDSITIVEFSPYDKNYFYGGMRGDKWYLVKEGKEITAFDQTTSLKKGTGLQYFGEKNPTVRIWTSLAIFFADKADNYFMLCYSDNKGKIFKDGSWLSLEFKSFYYGGMALSQDGKNYSLALSPNEKSKAIIYIDGVAGPPFDAIDSAAYVYPGNKLVYVGLQGKKMIFMEGLYQKTDSLGGIIKTSHDKHHIALLHKKGYESVSVDDKEEASFPKVHWGFSGMLTSPGSFKWNNDCSAHAYVVDLTTDKNSPKSVIHNGKQLEKFAKIRESSISISDDGKYVAYVANENSKWFAVVNNSSQMGFEEVGNPVFIGNDGQVAYAAKSDQHWVIKGLSDSPKFLDVGPLIKGPNNDIAYAAKIEGGKWQVFHNTIAISRPYEEIVANIGIQFGNDGTIRFVAKSDNKLFWVENK